MASADGRRLSDNASGAGDEFKCNPCSNSGLVKDADKFCRECEEYMCASCAGIHKSVKASRNHTVVSCSALRFPGQRDVGTLPLAVGPASNRTSFIDMKVATSADITIPDGYITGSTMTPDGRLVLVHYDRNQLILFDRDFTVQSSLTLPGYPYDVAADGDNDVIVCMTDTWQLQWINVDGCRLLVGRTVTTSGPCWGVVVHSGHIYISVRTVTKPPAPGHVEVLTRDGSVVRRIGVDASGVGTLTSPHHITVGASGTIYVSEWTSKGRVTCFSSSGGTVYAVTHSDMRGTCGMVADDDGNLLVCSELSNNVNELAKDGSHNRTILTIADGVFRPYCMAYRRSDDTLIVTMLNRQSCRVYKLK